MELNLTIFILFSQLEGIYNTKKESLIQNCSKYYFIVQRSFEVSHYTQIQWHLTVGERVNDMLSNGTENNMVYIRPYYHNNIDYIIRHVTS